MNLNSSPRSVLSSQDAVPLDPNEINKILMTKGEEKPTYDAISRESTPDVITDAEQWIDRIEGLQKSISCLDNSFDHEEWRQNNIIDDRYWLIEADHWESYYDSVNDESKPDRSRQEEDLFGKQQAQHNFCFFRDIEKINWLSTYTQITAKFSAVAQDKCPRLVFDTTYHRYHASYWAKLCQRRGYTQFRKSIMAVQYWQTEFACIHRELLRLERRSLDAESRPLQGVRVSKRRKNARITSNGGDMKGNRPRARDKRSTKADKVAPNVRRSARLRRRCLP